MQSSKILTFCISSFKQLKIPQTDNNQIDETQVLHFSKIVTHFWDKDNRVWLLMNPLSPLIIITGQKYLCQIHGIEETFISKLYCKVDLASNSLNPKFFTKRGLHQITWINVSPFSKIKIISKHLVHKIPFNFFILYSR